MSIPLVQFKDVVYGVDGRTILDHITFDLFDGEFVSLIGPNGAGKTTFLKLLIGRIAPTSGAITLQKGIGIGYMPQSIHLDPTLPITVERFMDLYSDNRKEIHEALEAVRAKQLLNKNMAQLSGGELQRVLLARCLLSASQLLILDEPVQWVDFLGQRQLYELIIDYHQNKGRTILMVSHDLNLVLKRSDRVICLNSHICCEGKPDHVQSSAPYQALFPAAQDFTTYTHHHDHTHDHH